MATGGSAGALRRFELDRVHDTGREVGHGSYAVVKELEYHGLKCVGKKIHAILYESATPHEKAAMLERFAGECELLGGLHHPCIVQFLGVWFEQGSQLPMLVMEYLHTTLSACLERYGILPKEISYVILRDVALGLRYLHERSPPIIHRDLSANNVLLTSNMNAKLSDLGVAKIFNLTPARMTQMTQTKAPGTPCYMPPEALTAKPKYTSKIDIYSYGVLIIHTLCGKWPFPEGVFRPDPQNPDKMIPIPEVERRAEYLREIGNDHPLMTVICHCLSDLPAQRPEARTLLDQVNTILSTLPQQFINKVEMLQQFEARIQTLTAAKQLEINSKQLEIESLRSEIKRLSFRHSTPQAHSPLSNASQPTNISPQPSHASQSSHVGEPSSSRQPSHTEKPKPPHKSKSHHRHAKLQWKRCADMPVGMAKAHAVMMGEKVYMGGGTTRKVEYCNWVFQYDTSKDEWSYLPPCQIIYFAMAQFERNLITVGGLIPGVGVTGKLYHFKNRSQMWEEFLKPMPTARYQLSVATTQSAIVASGGVTDVRDGKAVLCATVEVYSSESAQWYTADPLPVSCRGMTSVTIADTFYQLGGSRTNDKDIHTVLCAPLTMLIQNATSSTHKSASRMSIWKTLHDTPLKQSAAAILSGNLLAVGGCKKRTASTAVHVFLPSSNSWIRAATGDVPEPCCASTTIQLASSRLLVVGGLNHQYEHTKITFLGSLTE